MNKHKCLFIQAHLSTHAKQPIFFAEQHVVVSGLNQASATEYNLHTYYNLRTRKLNKVYLTDRTCLTEYIINYTF